MFSFVLRRQLPRRLAIQRQHLTTATRSICPSCSNQLPTALPTCSSCKYIAPLPPQVSNHELFQLPTHPNPFKIDTADLKRRFLEAQRVCHPDAWSGKGGGLAAAQSSQLNEAYQTMLSPRKRAQYILAQNGIEASETDQLNDRSFVMEVMNAREELEEEDTVDGVQRLQDANRDRIADTINSIEVAIEKGDWSAAQAATVHLRYWEGLEEAAKERLHSLG